MAENLSFRAGIRRILPPWMRDRPTLGKTVAYRYAASWAAVLDVLMQAAIEGMLSALPTHGTPTAFPFHGRDRGIVRGPEQPASDYALQLTEWLKFARRAGNAWSVASNLQRYLGPTPPKVRIVTRGGFWTTLNSDGSLEFHRGTAWDWDSVTHPERADSWWDIWVIVYAPPFTTAGTFGDDSGDSWGQAKAFGHETSIGNARQIKALVHKFKGAHAHVVTLIMAYDAASFDPETLASFPTDGTWGNFSRLSGGVRVRSRVSTARYWEIN